MMVAYSCADVPRISPYSCSNNLPKLKGSLPLKLEATSDGIVEATLNLTGANEPALIADTGRTDTAAVVETCPVHVDIDSGTLRLCYDCWRTRRVLWV